MIFSLKYCQYLLCGILLISGNSLSAQVPSHLAYIELNSDLEGKTAAKFEGCVLMGSYQSGKFMKSPELSASDPDLNSAVRTILAAFPDGKIFDGIDLEGNRIKGEIGNSDPEAVNDIGGITLNVDIKQGPQNEKALLFTSPLDIRILKRIPVNLSPAIDSLLRQDAKRLWTKHLSERVPEERPVSFTLKFPIVERIEGADEILTVIYPMDIEEWIITSREGKTDQREIFHDHRGSMFFIYSLQDKKIILGTFGHPEWSSRSTVRTIKPELYFRISDNPEIFFIGEDDGGWESIGHSLFNLRTGREILACF